MTAKMTSAAELSKLLFEAREIAAMYGDVVEASWPGGGDYCYAVRDRLDAYRAERGWSPHGFGGEQS